MEKTEKTGAEPEKTEVKTEDKSGAVLDAKDVKSDSSPENVPWNKDPRFQEFIKEKKTLSAANEKLQKLLKANDLEDPDDLEDLVARGKVVKGKLNDLNQLDEIIEKANKLTKYEAYWAEQEEKNRRQNEDPDSTISRLEGLLKSKSAKEQHREYERHQAEQAKAAISGYDNEVKNLIKEMEMPKDQQGFILEFMGVGNPANDIDITDKKAVKRLVAEATKKKEAYDQAIIKAYLSGKEIVPKVGSSGSGAPEPNKPKIYLKDARKALHEMMQKSTGG
jgi:hypothetical protein